MPVFIDLPDGPVAGGRFRVAGWAATNGAPDGISVRIDGRSVPHVLHARPSLLSAPGLGGFALVTGVLAEIDLGGAAAAREVVVELLCGAERAARTVTLTAGGEASADDSPEQRALRAASAAWVEERLRCPRCRTDGRTFDRRGGVLACRACGAEFAQAAVTSKTGAINMILPEMGLTSDVSATDNVSSNPYTTDAAALIAATTAAGGWVLDCGAGRRPKRLARVINLEIVDYPSTDVLGVGESLPFQTGSFDAVVSLAVLEHVRDPFACAREIVRVLKPGGVVRADVPFLQPSHGYPHHYYNMTKQGLENLFAGLGEIVECKVPLHGQPILAVQWILSQYLLGLPAAERDAFARMTIGEAAAIDVVPFLLSGHPAVTSLSPAAREIIGCLNSILVRKG